MSARQNAKSRCLFSTARTTPPTREELHALTTRIVERIARLRERRAIDAGLGDAERPLCAAFVHSAAPRGTAARAPEDADTPTTPSA